MMPACDHGDLDEEWPRNSTRSPASAASPSRHSQRRRPRRPGHSPRHKGCSRVGGANPLGGGDVALSWTVLLAFIRLSNAPSDSRAPLERKRRDRARPKLARPAMRDSDRPHRAPRGSVARIAAPARRARQPNNRRPPRRAGDRARRPTLLVRHRLRPASEAYAGKTRRGPESSDRRTA
jgi:hypothetical protein